MKRSRPPRGFTLIEAGVVLSLLAGLMTLVALYFVRGRRYTAQTETYAGVQRTANQIVRRVTDDLYRGSTLQSQTNSNSVLFLSFMPEDPSKPYLVLDPTGKILWQKWVGYYHDPARQAVIRTVTPLDTPTSDVMISPEPAIGLADLATVAGPHQPFGEGSVRDFSVHSTGKRFVVSLTAQSAAPVSGLNDTDRQVSVTVTAEVSLQN